MRLFSRRAYALSVRTPAEVPGVPAVPAQPPWIRLFSMDVPVEPSHTPTESVAAPRPVMRRLFAMRLQPPSSPRIPTDVGGKPPPDPRIELFPSTTHLLATPCALAPQ